MQTCHEGNRLVRRASHRGWWRKKINGAEDAILKM
jgi:hypothetical protein